MGGLLAGLYSLREERPRISGFVFSGPGFEAGEAFGPAIIAAARVIGKVSATSGIQGFVAGNNLNCVFKLFSADQNKMF
jgi:alpha-beta hydrolase superfamily lysophospholipase